MLAEGKKTEVVKESKDSRKEAEYEALQSFLRSISSTATLPPYVKGESYSSLRGVINQVGIVSYIIISTYIPRMPLLWV